MTPLQVVTIMIVAILASALAGLAYSILSVRMIYAAAAWAARVDRRKRVRHAMERLIADEGAIERHEKVMRTLIREYSMRVAAVDDWRSLARQIRDRRPSEGVVALVERAEQVVEERLAAAN